MTAANPAWHPLDLSAGTLPESLRRALGDPSGPGRVILVAATPAAADDAWAARAAIRVAEACARESRRVLLVDLDLERPALAGALGLSEGEGISDAILFGASLQRVGRAVQDGAFLFVSAGTIVGDPARVLDHPGWNELLEAHTASGTVVVLYVPAGARGAEALLALAGSVVFLGTAEERPPVDDLSPSVELAWLGRPTAEDAVAGRTTEGEGTREEAEAPQDSLAADPSTQDPPSAVPAADAGRQLEPDEGTEAEPGVQREPGAQLPAAHGEDELDPFWDESGAAVPEAPDSAGDEWLDPSPEPSEHSRSAVDSAAAAVPERTRERSRGRLLLWAAVLFVLGAAAVWAMVRGRGDPEAVGQAVPGDESVQVSASRAAEDPANEESRGVPDGEAPTPDGGVVSAASRFGLTINAHERLEAARDQARELSASFPDLHFVLAPVAVNGVPYFRVIAGPAASRTEAETLRERLSGVLGSWVARRAILRPTRQAFLLADVGSRAEALALHERAEEAGIPAYVTAVESDDPRFRVYAGAYGSATEASYLRALLADAGFEGAELTERTGRLLR